MLIGFIICMIILAIGIWSIPSSLICDKHNKDIASVVLGCVAVFGVLIGGFCSLFIGLQAAEQKSWNNEIVDGIVETPSKYIIFFDNNDCVSLDKSEDITIIKDTDVMKVNTIRMFTYSFEIPEDCIIWQWQPYNKAYK